MIKVVHVVESFGGGVLFFLSNLINGLGEDFRHVVVHGIRESTPPDFTRYFSDNVRFIRWKWTGRQISPLKDLKSSIFLYKVLKNIEFDVVHLHSSKAGFIGRLVSRLLGREMVTLYTPHGLSFLRLDVNKLQRKIYIFLEMLANHFGGIVVACSESEAEELKKRGISAIYVNNGINCTSIGKLVDEEIPEKGKFVVATIGRVTYQKNPYLFNRIAERFANDSQVKFKWIGGGELEYLLKAPNIEVTGWLSHEETLAHAMSIDLYLSTSLWEGLPISGLEVMCLQKPLLLKKVTGNIDLVQHGKNGFLFETEDEAAKYIIRLKSERSLLKVMGKESFTRIQEEFSLNYMLKAYRRLYEKVAGGRSKRTIPH